jgi:hypothetical protein
MRTDIDYTISLMKEYTPKIEGELGEQEEAPATGGKGAGRKWETGLTRGPANMLGLKGSLKIITNYRIFIDYEYNLYTY